MAGQHFVQHTAKCPDVGALVDRLPSRLLRTHVGRRAEDGPFLRAAHGHRRRLQLAGRRLREAEVQHLHDAARGDFDIRRFEIPVHDPFLVRGVERIGDLTRDRERVCDWHRSALDPIGQRLAFHQLEHQRPDATGVLRGRRWRRCSDD